MKIRLNSQVREMAATLQALTDALDTEGLRCRGSRSRELLEKARDQALQLRIAVSDESRTAASPEPAVLSTELPDNIVFFRHRREAM